MHPEYSNADVETLLLKLGPFNYGKPSEDRVKRVTKPVTLLDNKTKYEGQWNEDTNERDGMGVLLWPDGSIYEGWWTHN